MVPNTTLVAELDHATDQLRASGNVGNRENPDFVRSRTILFTADGYRVVMRFYSEHGSLQGIQEIKRSFTIAMRRKGAFPACKIQWLT